MRRCRCPLLRRQTSHRRTSGRTTLQHDQLLRSGWAEVPSPRSRTLLALSGICYTYDSFGKQTSFIIWLIDQSYSSTPPANSILSLDCTTFGPRYLDSSTGRFLGEDPVKFYAGINFYTYALNSPTYWIDPSGFNVTVKLFPGNQPGGHIGLGVNTDDTRGLLSKPRYTLLARTHSTRRPVAGGSSC